MQFNSILFPAPPSSYTADLVSQNLIWVERLKSNTKLNGTISKATSSSDKLTTSKDNLAEPEIKKTTAASEYKKSTTALTELDLSKLNGHKDVSPKGNFSIYLDLEKENGEGASPKASLQDMSFKGDDRQVESPKNKKKGQYCLGFLFGKKQQRPERDIIIESPSPNTPDPKKVRIPCLYIKSRAETQKTLVFFHSNGEDLYQTFELLRKMSEYFQVNVLGVEYPGYGIYKGSPTEKTVLLDAEAVYSYIVNDLQVKEEDIMIVGRSIGSGPATWLASFNNPGALILISPFTSIRAVVKNVLGKTAQYFVKERFNNLKIMHKIRCPVFILHGKKDALISFEQALELSDKLNGPKKVHLVEDMDHNSFHFFNDFVEPLKKYLNEHNLFISETKSIQFLPSEVLSDAPITEIKVRFRKNVL